MALGGAIRRRPPSGAWSSGHGLYNREQVAAFQNGYFVALCNRVGEEDCLTFGGESFICSPDGRVIARAAAMKDETLTADVDLSENVSSHAKRLFLQHRRRELYADWIK